MTDAHDDAQDDENPFERYGIDPLGGPAAITERMRELAEDAPDEAARRAIRAAWEELTLHPARRLRAALGAHPGSGPPLAPPRPTARRAPRALAVELVDLVLRPRLLDAIDAPEHAELPDLPPGDDPRLG